MRLTWVAAGRQPGLGEVYLGIGLLAILVARFFPLDLFAGVYRCPALAIAGVPCLSCGFTRSWVRLAHLEVGGAFHVSPLGALLFLGIVLYVLFAGLRLAFGLSWPRLQLGGRELVALRVLLVLALAGNWGYLLVRHLVIGDWG